MLDLGSAWLTAPPAAALPGYVCLVAKRHVVEPFELNLSEGHAVWDALMAVARGVSEATAPVKLNYEIHGNTVPHLHVHIYPRFPGDPFEGRPIDPSGSAPFQRSDEELDRMRLAVIKAMAELGLD